MLSGNVANEHISSQSVAAPYFAPRKVNIESRDDGTLVLTSPIAFKKPDWSILDFLPVWAEKAPERIFLAQRGPDGKWQSISYADMWKRVQAVGQYLLDQGAKRGDTLALLSGNSIEHAVVMFAAMSVSVVVAPISPNYSLMPGGLARLQDISTTLRPSFVFVQDAETYAAARNIPELASAIWIAAADRKGEAVALESLYQTVPGAAFEQAFRSVEKEAPAKILFTSGSTGLPKGVINTHLMMASALEMGSLLVPPPRVSGSGRMASMAPYDGE